MGLDEIEQRCLEFGVSITLTPLERELGKNIRNLEENIKELIIKISGKNDDSDEYLELYELQNSISQLRKRYSRYTKDKVDLDEQDTDLQSVLSEELEEIKNDYLRMKKIIDKYAKKIVLDAEDNSFTIEWEKFLKERAQNKVANVIITNRAFTEFQKYFLDTSGSRDISMQVVEGLLKTLDALETHVNLFTEDLGSSKKLNISNKGVMEYLITKGGTGGVFRAIYFYDNNQSRIVYSLLFKTEAEKTDEVGKDADRFISQAERGTNHSRTSNELSDIRKAIESDDLQVYENRVLFMYKELFRLRKELQKNSMDIDDESVDEDDDSKQSGRKSI